METADVIICLLVIFPHISGFQNFQLLIPNGGSVPDPCKQGVIWPGVGHKQPGGSGPRNAFGVDFLNNNMQWNRQLCEKDSDGDGMSNGAELGDPNCTWTSESESEPLLSATRHPGICEPWSDPYCLQRNTWYSCQVDDLECDAINSADVMNMTVSFPETPVPSEETTYICMNFEFPNDTDYHIIADTGAIVNSHVVHHILIYACPSDTESSELIHPMNTPYDCNMQGESLCNDIIGIWSVGIPGFCYNEIAGFKIGKTGYKYASMQIHWNNPSHRPDYKDSSGITLYYTPNLRQYNLGNLAIGEERFSIPPGEDSYSVESACSSTCSSRIMSQSINVISGINHMHYMGKAMTTSLVSGEQQLDFMDDPYYNYDNPMIHIFNNPLEIKPGDELKTKCTFQSTRKNLTTFQGEATSDEMCYAFLFYYPKEALDTSSCVTIYGIPECTLLSYTDYIDGCQIRSFYEDNATLEFVFEQIGELCSYTCRKECKEFIKETRQNPCLQGKLETLMLDYLLRPYLSAEFLLLYHSCDLEIFQEENTCPCTTPTISECENPYTGTAAVNQAHLNSILILMFIFVFVFLITE